jgi:GTP-binding protein
MIIKSAQFISSHALLAKLPAPNLPEFAFIGRSNVGKSSLINMLCHRKGLAKTSSTPGKTQTINHFLINDLWYLVDLPGYGFAKTSKALKNEWAGFTFDYLKKRTNLLCTFVLIDVRHEPQKLDIALMEWFATNQIPFAIAFTKTDKLTTNHVNTHVATYKHHMLQTWESLPQIFITSAEKTKGKDDILTFIEQVIDESTL